MRLSFLMGTSRPVLNSNASKDEHDIAEQLAPPREGWLFRSYWGLAVLSLLFALLVFVLGFGLDWLLLYKDDSIRQTVEFSDAVAALICGFIFLLFLRLYRQQRALLRQRVEVIANMNHHVRNALQVIEFNSYSTADKEKFEAIKSSVNRIQWALRELLPKI
jgi:signal transduction histidine kinase